MSKETDISRLSMFYPKTKRGLLVDYPELEKNQALRGLSRSDILFAWYFACKSSPFIKEEDQKIRAQKAIEESYGQNPKNTMVTKFLAGDFPIKLKAAIAEMNKFEIGPRVKAKIMVEKIMNNYFQLVDIDPDREFKDKDKEENWTKKKAYIDSCAKISASLPGLIDQAEGGFSLSEKEEGEVIEIDSVSLIDKFHNEEE